MNWLRENGRFLSPNGGDNWLTAAVALRNIDKLSVPQWSLVRDLDGIELFEALRKRFGVPGDGPNLVTAFLILGGADPSLAMQGVEHRFAYDQAKPYYFAALIAHGRNADAETIANETNDTDHFMEFEWRPIFDALDHA